MVTWQSGMERFWKRWKYEYLLQLRMADEGPRGASPHLNVGDVVIVNDDLLPLFWRPAGISPTLPGRNGVTRAYKI